MNTLIPRLRSSALVGVVCFTAAWAAPAMAEIAATQIFQQRGADGRIVLTDRPSPTALTERTWQVEREDPAAAQRAGNVQREAEAVSARIERRLDNEQRRAMYEDIMRRQIAGLDRHEAIVADDGVVIGPPLLRPFRIREQRIDSRRDLSRAPNPTFATAARPGVHRPGLESR